MNHYDRATEHLTAAQLAREALDRTYAGTVTDAHRRKIAALNDAMRHNMAVARMHAHLAEVDAIYDLRGSVDTLFQALAAEPEPLTPVGPVLELVNPRCPNCEQATYSGECPDCKDGVLS